MQFNHRSTIAFGHPLQLVRKICRYVRLYRQHCSRAFSVHAACARRITLQCTYYRHIPIPMSGHWTSTAMTGVYSAVWRSLSSLYLDDMSPGQHLAVMVTAGVTIVAILVGGCWTCRQRRRSSDNSADSTANLQAHGKSFT